jgi:hypothetical protein
MGVASGVGRGVAVAVGCGAAVGTGKVADIVAVAVAVNVGVRVGVRVIVGVGSGTVEPSTTFSRPLRITERNMTSAPTRRLTSRCKSIMSLVVIVPVKSYISKAAI